MRYKKIRKHQDSGQLNKRVQIDREIENRDAAGGKIPGWGKWKTKWCKVENKGTRALFFNNAWSVVDTKIFTIVYDSDIYTQPAEKLSLVYEYRRYKIKTMENVEDAAYSIEIICDANDWERVGA